MKCASSRTGDANASRAASAASWRPRSCSRSNGRHRHPRKRLNRVAIPHDRAQPATRDRNGAAARARQAAQIGGDAATEPSNQPAYGRASGSSTQGSRSSARTSEAETRRAGSAHGPTRARAATRRPVGAADRRRSRAPRASRGLAAATASRRTSASGRRRRAAWLRRRARRTAKRSNASATARTHRLRAGSRSTSCVCGASVSTPPRMPARTPCRRAAASAISTTPCSTPHCLRCRPRPPRRQTEARRTRSSGRRGRWMPSKTRSGSPRWATAGRARAARCGRGRVA